MTRKLDATLVRDPDAPDGFALYFCRGAGKCTRTEAEKKKLSRKNRACPDCVRGREEETLEQLAERIAKGDA
jgi:hypothetical protein